MRKLHLHNIYNLKIGIEFNSAMKYTLGGNLNINSILFRSLGSNIVIIVFGIVMHPNLKMKNVLIIE